MSTSGGYGVRSWFVSSCIFRDVPNLLTCFIWSSLFTFVVNKITRDCRCEFEPSCYQQDRGQVSVWPLGQMLTHLTELSIFFHDLWKEIGSCPSGKIKAQSEFPNKFTDWKYWILSYWSWECIAAISDCKAKSVALRFSPIGKLNGEKMGGGYSYVDIAPPSQIVE